MPNTLTGESQSPFTAEYEASENEANRRMADEMVKAAVEGLNRLAREKAAAKSPSQAA